MKTIYKLILVSLLIILLASPCSAWLSGWDYRKSHEIIGNSTWGSSQTNYQMQFNVYRSSGTDSGNSIYLGTKVLSDYDDLRFTTSDDTLCDYWVQSSNSSVAVVWVEFPTITTGTNTFYVYYGNSSASSYSNGLNTFPLLFDTFDEASLNTTKWSFAGYVYKYTGYVNLYYGGQIYSDDINSLNTSTHFTAVLKNTQTESIGYHRSSDGYYIQWAGDGSNIKLNAYNSIDGYDTYYYESRGIYDINEYEIKNAKNSSTYYTNCYINNTLKDEENPSIIYSTYPILVYTSGSSSSSNLNLYEIFITNYQINEPIHSTYGSEFDINCIASFDASSTSISTDEIVTFTDTSTGTITNWSWDLDGDGSFDNTTEQNVAYQYTSPGIYNIHLLVNNTENSDWDNSTYIYVGQPPVANFTGSPLSGEYPLLVSFTDTTTNGTPTTWNWTFGDGETSTDQNPHHTYDAIGVYTVSLNVTNDYGYDLKTKTNYISATANETTSYYGSQYAPSTVRFIVQDYYGRPQSDLHVVATPSNTSMGSWGWLDWLYGVNENVNLQNSSLSGITGSDGTISFVMLDSIKYTIWCYNDDLSINQTFTIYPKGSDEYLYISQTIPDSIQDVYSYNISTTLNENDTYTIEFTFTGYTDETLDIYVRNNNGTTVYNTSTTPYGNISIDYLLPYHEGQSYSYGFNVSTDDYGNVNVTRSDIIYPEKVDIELDDTWMSWLSVGIIIVFAAIFSRGNTVYGVIIVPAIAGLLIYMGWMPLSMMSSVSILLVIGVLIYIKTKHTGGR